MKVQKPSDLREACVAEALAIIGEAGVERLSIREVARRLGVSHQAPYRHFPSSDHLLAELVRRTYVLFGEHLEGRPQAASPVEEMHCMGVAYFRFATEFPLHYRLMFGTPLPDPAKHPEMMHEARKAFALLLRGVEGLRGPSRTPGDVLKLQADALFVWSVVHGMATLLQTTALQQLRLDYQVLQRAMPHALECIGRAMDCLPAGVGVVPDKATAPSKAAVTRKKKN